MEVGFKIKKKMDDKEPCIDLPIKEQEELILQHVPRVGEIITFTSQFSKEMEITGEVINVRYNFSNKFIIITINIENYA